MEVVVGLVPQHVILGEGELRSFDLDDDGVDDLVVSVENISNSFAEIKIQSLDGDSDDEIIVGDVMDSDEDDVGISTITGAVTGAMGTTVGIAAIMFVVLVGGGFVIVRVRNKKS